MLNNVKLHQTKGFLLFYQSCARVRLGSEVRWYQIIFYPPLEHYYIQEVLIRTYQVLLHHGEGRGVFNLNTLLIFFAFWVSYFEYGDFYINNY